MQIWKFIPKLVSCFQVFSCPAFQLPNQNVNHRSQQGCIIFINVYFILGSHFCSLFPSRILRSFKCKKLIFFHKKARVLKRYHRVIYKICRFGIKTPFWQAIYRDVNKVYNFCYQKQSTTQCLQRPIFRSLTE